VLEIVSKKRFDILVRQKLFVPLGMRRTSFTDMQGGPVDPSGGASSTAEDYIKFLGMLLNKGKFGGKQIISEASINQMMQVMAGPDKIKFAPKSAQGYSYALGAWVLESDTNGKGTALTCPGLFGTWPVVDYCRGYAYLVLVKTLLDEDKAAANNQIKEAIDRVFASTCK
jgi:CubicO group peptidase (beta-lactamase class C family)